LAADFKKDPKKYYEGFLERYAKLKRITATNEEIKVEKELLDALFAKESKNFSELTFESALAAKVFPRVTEKEVVAKALSIWENTDSKQRQEALDVEGKAQRCRTDIADRVGLEYKKVHAKEGYALGKAEMTQPEKSALPSTLDSNLEYRAIGGVSSVAYSANKQKDWENWSKTATEFLRLSTSCRIYNQFPNAGKDHTKVLGAIDALARLNAEILPRKGYKFEANDFKKTLEDRFGKDFLYGSSGVLNMLLALQRAKAEIPAGADESKVLYDLRVERGNKAKSRFSQLDVAALKKGKVQDKVDDSQKDEAQILADYAQATKAKERKEATPAAVLLSDFEKEFEKEFGAAKIEADLNTIGFDLEREHEEKPVRVFRMYAKNRTNREKTILASASVTGNPPTLNVLGKSYDQETQTGAVQTAMIHVRRIMATLVKGQAQVKERIRQDALEKREKWYADYNIFLNNNEEDLGRARITFSKNSSGPASVEVGKNGEKYEIPHEYVFFLDGRRWLAKANPDDNSLKITTELNPMVDLPNGKKAWDKALFEKRISPARSIITELPKYNQEANAKEREMQEVLRKANQ